MRSPSHLPETGVFTKFRQLALYVPEVFFKISSDEDTEETNTFQEMRICLGISSLSIPLAAVQGNLVNLGQIPKKKRTVTP
jgi:hypothetical protein